MRKQHHQIKLYKTKVLSRSILGEHRVDIGDEIFIYENGYLVAYTDTRVIDHETDRLVNLAENPYIDEEVFYNA